MTSRIRSKASPIGLVQLVSRASLILRGSIVRRFSLPNSIAKEPYG